jgi:hypothetical protein
VQPPSLTALPVKLPALPVMDAMNATPHMQVPALAQIESGPLGMFSNLVADLSGKQFHTQ